MKLVRRFAPVSLLTLALLVSGYSTPVARRNDAMANLDAFIAKTLQEYQVPGAAVAVVQDGKVTLLKGYGVRDVTKPGAGDENTIFQLASVTKTLTAQPRPLLWTKASWIGTSQSLITCPNLSGYDPYMTRFLADVKSYRMAMRSKCNAVPRNIPRR